MNTTNENTKKRVYKVLKSELPACCPPKDQEHWNQHPRVYLDLKTNGEAHCPYCVNHFKLV